MTWSDGGIKPFHPDLIPADVPIEPNGVIMIGEKGVITCDAYAVSYTHLTLPTNREV